MPFDKPTSGVKDWLEGCVPWNGKEKTLPTGALMPPKINVIRMIKSWTVLREDGEVVERVKTAKISSIPGAIIIGAEPNNKAIRAIMNTYGVDAFWFMDSYGRKYKPEMWAKKYKTNPFVVLAIMRMR